MGRGRGSGQGDRTNGRGTRDFPHSRGAEAASSPTVAQPSAATLDRPRFPPAGDAAGAGRDTQSASRNLPQRTIFCRFMGVHFVRNQGVAQEIRKKIKPPPLPARSAATSTHFKALGNCGQENVDSRRPSILAAAGPAGRRRTVCPQRSSRSDRRFHRRFTTPCPYCREVGGRT